jgi:hypothetical protein
MTESEWQVCDEPDLMLEHLMGKVSRAQLVTFVRQCWQRVAPYLPALPHSFTAVEQFAEIADTLNDHDAAIYASEAALKAAGLAPDMRAEQRHQSELLRQILGTVQSSNR